MEKKPKVFKWALVIGIIVVLNLFFNYTISLFYKEPNFDNYFPQTQIVEPITTKEACLKIGGQWVKGLTYNEKNMRPNFINSSQTKNYCNPNFTKQQEFNEAQKTFQRNIFIILVVLGVISLILGVFIANEIIALSLSWGGVLSLIISSMRYWSTADNLIKVLILGFALVALIWLAIKKFT